MRIIVGLGNPGKEYEKTRHNAGFMALDLMAKEKKLKWETSKKFKAEIIKDGDTVYAKPQTYMNLSGETARRIMDYYDMAKDFSDSLTVIHDDLDIELGKHKLSTDSRSAGHNGVQSIIDILHTKNFRRIRIGIKTPDLVIIPAEKFVLGRFKKDELNVIDKVIKDIINEFLE
jgi:peptidyl-tRNA hydrolase, PTH1 family